MLVLTRNFSQAVHIGPLRLIVADGIGIGITLIVTEPPADHVELHRIAIGESADIGHGARVFFLGKNGRETVSIGIDAPDDVRILREELVRHERAGGVA